MDVEQTQTTASGLRIIDLKEGPGAEATAGQTVVVHYRGTLEDGTQFDASYDRGTPFSFPLGRGRVIKGWDEGVQGMKVGGKRKLVIPPDLGYGSRGAGYVIPPGATLIFEVELVAVEGIKSVSSRAMNDDLSSGLFSDSYDSSFNRNNFQSDDLIDGGSQFASVDFDGFHAAVIAPDVALESVAGDKVWSLDDLDVFAGLFDLIHPAPEVSL